jgi:hypothetical protein
MGIYVSIQPIAMILILIVTINLIMSFGKNNLMFKGSIALSSILSIIGIVGMMIIRLRFVKSLNRSANNRSFETKFITWAIEKFDFFAFISILATCFVIIALLFYLFLNKKRNGFVWTNITSIVIALMIINFIVAIWYSLGTINKLFDIAAYIFQLSIAEFFAMHIPLIVKRILIHKKV